jgi:hypothetical protein
MSLAGIGQGWSKRKEVKAILRNLQVLEEAGVTGVGEGEEAEVVVEVVGVEVESEGEEDPVTKQPGIEHGRTRTRIKLGKEVTTKRWPVRAHLSCIM